MKKITRAFNVINNLIDNDPGVYQVLNDKLIKTGKFTSDELSSIMSKSVTLEELDRDEVILLYSALAEHYPSMPEIVEYFKESEIEKVEKAYINKKSFCLNESLKNQFLATQLKKTKNEKDEKSIKKYLIQETGKFELLFNKDFYGFNMDEVKTLFESNHWATPGMFSRAWRYLRLYIKWCKDNGYFPADKIHPVERLRYDDLKGYKKFKSDYFADFKDFQNYLEAVIDPKVSGQPDARHFLMIRTFFELIWLGYKLDEACYVKKYHVDAEKRTIRNGYNSRVLTDVPLSVIKHCLELREMEEYPAFKDNTKSAKTIAQVPFQKNDLLFRSRETWETKKNNERFMRSSFNIWQMKMRALSNNLPLTHKYYGKNIDFWGVWGSGMYSRLLAWEKEHNFNLSFNTGRVSEEQYHKRIEAFKAAMPGMEISDVQQVSHMKMYVKWKEYFHPDA